MTRLAPFFSDYRAAGALHSLVSINSRVDQQIFATKSGGLVLFLTMRGVDPECLDPEQIEAVTRGFGSALRALDERFRIYQYLAKRAHPGLPGERHPHPIVDEAVHSRMGHLAAQKAGLYEMENVLAILYEGWHPAAKKRTGFSAACLVRTIGQRLSRQDTEADFATDLDHARELLRTKAAQFVAQLQGTLDIRVMGGDEGFRFLRRLLNYSPVISDPVGLKSSDFVDWQACSSHLECHRDYLRVGERYVSVLTLKEPPSQTFAQMLRGLADVHGSFTLCSEWRREDAGKIRGLIQSKRRHFHHSKTSLSSHLGEGNPSAPADRLVNTGADAMVGDLGESLRSLELHGTNFGEFSLAIVIYDSDPEALRRAVAHCFKVFATCDAQLIEEHYNRLNAFLAVVPGNSAFNLRRLWLSQANYADLSFLFASDVGEVRNSHLDAEYLTVFETAAGVPYFFNFHYQDVAHAFLLGAAGAGKSFLLNWLLTHAQKYDPHTLIFDLGHSYESLTRLFSGSYLSLQAEKRPFTMNPFALEFSALHQRFLLAWVRVLIESGGYRLTSEQEQDLYEQIENLYELAPEQRRLSTLAHIVHRDLRRELLRWTKGGPYGDLFDHPVDTFTVASFQTFDFEGMNDLKEALEPLLFYVLHRASAAVDDDPRRFKLFVMDEAWRFFSHPTITRYLVEALKTWRKKNAALVLATQSGDDLSGSEFLSVIVESCPTQIFLSNPRMDQEAYRQLFHLNAREAELIAALAPKKELLIKRPDRSKVVSLSVDRKEYWIYTSHPQERERRREVIARHGFREGLDILAKESTHE